MLQSCGRSPDRATGRDRRSPEARETFGRRPRRGPETRAELGARKPDVQFFECALKSHFWGQSRAFKIEMHVESVPNAPSSTRDALRMRCLRKAIREVGFRPDVPPSHRVTSPCAEKNWNARESKSNVARKCGSAVRCQFTGGCVCDLSDRAKKHARDFKHPGKHF